MTTMTIEVPVSFQPVGRCGRKALPAGTDQPSLPPGRVPRVARLMALALRLDELVRTGQVRSYTELASFGQVTRARICGAYPRPACTTPVSCRVRRSAPATSRFTRWPGRALL